MALPCPECAWVPNVMITPGCLAELLSVPVWIVGIGDSVIRISGIRLSVFGLLGFISLISCISAVYLQSLAEPIIPTELNPAAKLMGLSGCLPSHTPFLDFPSLAPR